MSRAPAARPVTASAGSRAYREPLRAPARSTPRAPTRVSPRFDQPDATPQPATLSPRLRPASSRRRSGQRSRGVRRGVPPPSPVVHAGAAAVGRPQSATPVMLGDHLAEQQRRAGLPGPQGARPSTSMGLGQREQSLYVTRLRGEASKSRRERPGSRGAGFRTKQTRSRQYPEPEHGKRRHGGDRGLWVSLLAPQGDAWMVPTADSGPVDPFAFAPSIDSLTDEHLMGSGMPWDSSISDSWYGMPHNAVVVASPPEPSRRRPPRARSAAARRTATTGGHQWPRHPPSFSTGGAARHGSAAPRSTAPHVAVRASAMPVRTKSVRRQSEPARGTRVHLRAVSAGAGAGGRLGLAGPAQGSMMSAPVSPGPAPQWGGDRRGGGGGGGGLPGGRHMQRSVVMPLTPAHGLGSPTGSDAGMFTPFADKTGHSALRYDSQRSRLRGNVSP